MTEALVYDNVKAGECRVVRKFMLIPTTLKGVTRWGFVQVRQELTTWQDYDGLWWAWVDREFVEGSHDYLV
jgi:hypothetical protein